MTTRVIAWAERCRNCQACALACSLHHEGRCSIASARLTVDKDLGTGEVGISVCRQCKDAACVEACPNGAMRYEGSLVYLAEEECVQCGACMDACPYGAIYLVGDCHLKGDRYLKCDLCLGRDGGPICVELCPVGALGLEPETAEVR